MREILFRGYNRRIEKWIYGCLVKCWSKVKEDFIDDKPMIFSRNNNNHYEIDKDSIGQYTGFEDKCGNKIFEGDIIDNSKHRYIIVWRRGCWVAKDTYDLAELFLSSLGNDMQVAGNEYEEQLKKGERI